MRRLVVGAILFVLPFATACTDYSRPPLEVRGTTNQEKAQSIANGISSKYKSVLTVTDASIAANPQTKKRVVIYTVMFTVSSSVLGQPRSEEDARAQAEAIGKLTAAVADVMRLSTKHLLKSDRTLSAVEAQIHLPDGNALKFVGSAAVLINVQQDASNDAWLESVSTEAGVIVSKELWDEIQKVLNNQ